MSAATKQTYDKIVARCKAQTPSIDIEKHIRFETLKSANNTLDGITFKAVSPYDLAADFSGRMKLPGMENIPPPKPGALSFDTTRGPRSAGATMMSMQEDPGHWALKASFGATIGDGFREEWRAPESTFNAHAPVFGDDRISAGYREKLSLGFSDRISIGMGESGKELKFTALHAAVSPSVCNIHIDERGFVMRTPQGAAVTAAFWSHMANELLLKTKFRDWLDGKLPDNLLGNLVVEAVNRTSLKFADPENNFAGLRQKISGISGLDNLAAGVGKAFLPVGVSIDLIRMRQSTVQANWYWHDGQHTVTIGWGGQLGSNGR